MKINVEVINEGIVAFYKRVAEALGHTDDEVASYDPAKIWVSEERFDAIRQYYKDSSCEGADILDTRFEYDWLLYGPKADSSKASGEQVIIEEGFLVLE